MSVIGVISGLLTPTISVRIDPNDPLMGKMEIDPDFKEVAYRTKAAITTEYFGLEGIVKQGKDLPRPYKIKHRYYSQGNCMKKNVNISPSTLLSCNPCSSLPLSVYF